MSWLSEQLDSNPMRACECSINTWIKEVPQKTLVGLTHGHHPISAVPQCVMKKGPLRESLILELTFKALCEKLATIGLFHLAEVAPNNQYFEYLITQIFDEARHSSIFRNHLLELGFSDEAHIDQAILDINAEAKRDILDPLYDMFVCHVIEGKEFINGMAMVTIILEGVLAPSSELGELKWRCFDPVSADVQHSANVDEVRHLVVGTEIIREILDEEPEKLETLQACVDEGMELWGKVPIFDLIRQREELYQAGMEQFPELGRDAHINGTPLHSTTVEWRLNTAHEWFNEMQTSRIAYLGLK